MGGGARLVCGVHPLGSQTRMLLSALCTPVCSMAPCTLGFSFEWPVRPAWGTLQVCSAVPRASRGALEWRTSLGLPSPNNTRHTNMLLAGLCHPVRPTTPGQRMWPCYSV